MSTKANLRTQIKSEARIKSGTNLDTTVDRIVEDILRDYCNKSRYWEVLQSDIPVTLVAETGQYDLPDDFQNLHSVRFGIGPTVIAYRIVREQPEGVVRRHNNGYPRYYFLGAGPTITVFPSHEIATTDELLLSYYADPVSLYSAEDDPFPIPRLEPAVKKDAIARVQRLHADNQGAQLSGGDGRSSFVAAESAG